MPSLYRDNAGLVIVVSHPEMRISMQYRIIFSTVVGVDSGAFVDSGSGRDAAENFAEIGKAGDPAHAG